MHHTEKVTAELCDLYAEKTGELIVDIDAVFTQYSLFIPAHIQTAFFNHRANLVEVKRILELTATEKDV